MDSYVERFDQRNPLAARSLQGEECPEDIAYLLGYIDGLRGATEPGLDVKVRAAIDAAYLRGYGKGRDDSEAPM